MKKKTSAIPVLMAGLAGGAAAAGYLLWLRPWQLRWGSTNEEVKRAMPGDEIVKKPVFNATRAVSVQARPEHIFPWIVQIGITRAGWYSYDLIDNLGRPSSWEILPQFQTPEVDQIIPMSPDGKMGLYVKEWDAPNWMLWWDRKGDVSWAWGMYPQEDGSTRLITRVRMNYHWNSPQILFDLAIDVGDIVMMRKCMLGIKARAERVFAREALRPIELS